MNLPGSEAKKRILAYVLCGVAVLALYYIYSQLWVGSAPAAPAAPVISSTTTQAPSPTQPGHEARKLGTTAAALDPTLHMQQMRAAESVIYDGTGRNIFSAGSATPVAIPRPLQPARPSTPVHLVTAPAGPPPPPPIDLRFCGYFAGANDSDRRVILVHGDDVVLARAGDIVLRRYKLVSISANSIRVEDLPNSNTQTLPLIVHP